MRKPRYKRVPAPVQSIAEFVGDEIVGAVATLTPASIVGPWNATLRCRTFNQPFRPAFLPESHSHPWVEMCQMLHGRCALSYRRKHFVLGAGDLCFFPPDFEHAETRADPRVAYRLAWWAFEEERILVHVTDYTRSGGYRMMDRIPLQPPGQEAREAAKRLSAFAAGKNPPPILPVKECMLTLAVTLLRRVMADSSIDRSRARREVIFQVQRYVDALPANRPASISQVAQQAMLSPNYLTTLFRTETGISLGNYIKRRRIARAKELLSASNNSVKQIAFALGFEDPYTFSRAFKGIEGVSPARFRSLYL